MTIDLQLIKTLREETGAGVMDCRKALENADGKFETALQVLQQQAEEKALKRANHVAEQGRIELYTHGGGRIGVMVEINIETDFASRSEKFRTFCHEIALQIAAAAPLYITEADVPAEILAQETQKAEARARENGKPVAIIPTIVKGVLAKYQDQTVLLRQPYIRDEEMTVAQYLTQTMAVIGEKITIRRFQRWELDHQEEED